MPSIVAHDLIKKKTNITVGQRITSDLSTSNIEDIKVRRQSNDVRNIAKANQINFMGSTENLSNALILSKDELNATGHTFSRTLGSKKTSEFCK